MRAFLPLLLLFGALACQRDRAEGQPLVLEPAPPPARAWTTAFQRPAVLVAELFGDRVRRRAGHGECARIGSRFPGGYLAVQCSADFGDDETLSQLASQLERVARDRHLGVVLFRAGAAPWHDDLACYQRLAARLCGSTVALFDSLDLWDICALIAHSQGFIGSSLHGGIVAGAFALPRLGLLRPAQAPEASKQVAFAAAWGHPGQTRALRWPLVLHLRRKPLNAAGGTIHPAG